MKEKVIMVAATAVATVALNSAVSFITAKVITKKMNKGIEVLYQTESINEEDLDPNVV